MLRIVCWIREGAGLTNLIYCYTVHEKDILVTKSYAGLRRVLVYKVLGLRGTTVLVLCECTYGGVSLSIRALQ